MHLKAARILGHGLLRTTGVVRWRYVCYVLLCGSNASANPATPEVPARIEFNRDVRPILSENCFQCHGPDASHRKARLRLDVRERALAKEAFVPGQPEASELIVRVKSSDGDEL